MADSTRDSNGPPPTVEVVIEIPRGSFLKRGSSGHIDFTPVGQMAQSGQFLAQIRRQILAAYVVERSDFTLLPFSRLSSTLLTETQTSTAIGRD